MTVQDRVTPPHQHGPDCAWRVERDGKQRCQTARNERLRRRRAAGLKPTGGNPDRYKRQPPDGWEDEFGPVPLRVPRHEWLDRVIVDRAAKGIPTGRTPYRLEWEAILNRVPETVPAWKLAEATGVTERYVRDLRRAHG